MMTTPPAV